MNKLLVVIVNYNSSVYLKECLRSLERETDLEGISVVVVDNASQEGDFDSLSACFSWVDFELNDQNVGFARACNQGLNRHLADNYLLLNPDTEILDRAVEKVLKFLTQKPDAGIVGCRVVNADGTLQRASKRSIPTIENAFYRLVGLSRIFPNHPRFGRYNAYHLGQNRTHPVEAVSGSFLMFQRALLEQTGGLDERFFLYGEDLDFCLQSLQHGWTNYYYAGASVLHRKGQSSQSALSSTTFHFYDAMKLFYDKHYGKKAGPFERHLIHASIDLLYWQKRLRQRLFRFRSPGSAG